MSRAFVGENDGWRRCAKYMEDCLFANEQGECVLDSCRNHKEPEKGKSEEAKGQ